MELQYIDYITLNPFSDSVLLILRTVSRCRHIRKTEPVGALRSGARIRTAAAVCKGNYLIGSQYLLPARISREGGSKALNMLTGWGENP
jgi:hypothetical protein